jgi:hypothetical protein
MQTATPLMEITACRRIPANAGTFPSLSDIPQKPPKSFRRQTGTCLFSGNSAFGGAAVDKSRKSVCVVEKSSYVFELTG